MSKQESGRFIPDPERVKTLYDEVTKSFQDFYGETFQAGLFCDSQPTADPFLLHNLDVARRAGVRPGMVILDSGCGVCGPSIDIARHFPDVVIHAITISPVQMEIGIQKVAEAGLSDRIHVQAGDFHQLPYADEMFDLVVFLESAGYTYDLEGLLRGVYRVLKSGGMLYIKDPFRKDGELTDRQQHDLDEFCRVQVNCPLVPAEVCALLKELGFAEVGFLPVPDATHFSAQRYVDAMASNVFGTKMTNPFGQWQKTSWALKANPLCFGEITATKP